MSFRKAPRACSVVLNDRFKVLNLAVYGKVIYVYLRGSSPVKGRVWVFQIQGFVPNGYIIPCKSSFFMPLSWKDVKISSRVRYLLFADSFPSKTGLVSISKDLGLPAVVVALRVRTSFPCIAAGGSAIQPSGGFLGLPLGPCLRLEVLSTCTLTLLRLRAPAPLPCLLCKKLPQAP